MNISVIGVNFVNKGAELMLHAILERFQQKDGNYNFSLPFRQKVKDYEKCLEFGLDGLFTINKLKKYRNLPSKITPALVKDKYGLIDEKDVDVILDASGYWYSDFWPADIIERDSKLIKNWKKQGKKVVLLPQAFGPFNEHKNIESMNRIIEYSDLIFARDPKSFNHLNKIRSSENIKVAPDFTIGLTGIVPSYMQEYGKYISIIPNSRMFDKTDSKVSEWYMEFLLYCSKYLSENDYKFIFLIHEGKQDTEIAKKISDRLGKDIDIIEEENALKIKGIIKNSHAVISSRFHGLVSAFSQSVPCLGTGWSHKYRMLFNDFITDKYLINQDQSFEEVGSLLGQILSGDKRKELINKLNTRNNELNKEIDDMWDEVFNVVAN